MESKREQPMNAKKYPSLRMQTHSATHIRTTAPSLMRHPLACGLPLSVQSTSSKRERSGEGEKNNNTHERTHARTHAQPHLRIRCIKSERKKQRTHYAIAVRTVREVKHGVCAAYGGLPFSISPTLCVCVSLPSICVSVQARLNNLEQLKVKVSGCLVFSVS